MNVSPRGPGIALIAGLFALLLGVLSPAVAYATDDPVDPPPTGSVSGTVTHLGGGSVSELNVQLVAGDAEVATATTSAAGEFTFADVAPGEYTAKVTAGDDAATASVTVSAGEDAVVKLSVGTAPAAEPEGDEDEKPTGGLSLFAVAPASISGTVTAASGGPVEDVLVLIGNDDDFWEAAYTDEDGYYEFVDLDPGDYLIGVYPFDTYAYPAPVEVTLSAGDDHVQNFVLEESAYLTGIITDNNGDPIEGIEVEVWSGMHYSFGYSDENGEYLVEGISAGTYTVELYDDSNTYVLPEPIEVEFDTGQTVTRDFELWIGDRISGTVTGDGGLGVEGLEVFAYDDEGDYATQATTEADGTYVLGGLAPGTYEVEVHTAGSGYIESESRTVTVDGAVTGVDFVLTRGATISGTVVDPESQPAADVQVYLDGDGYWDAVYTEADGTYSFAGVPSGTYEVSGWIEDSTLYFGEVHEITAVAPETVTGVDFTLAVGGTISGTVTGPDGPLEGIEISVDGHQWGKHATTDASGHYTVTGVPTGTYDVWAQQSIPFIGSDWREVTLTAPEAVTGIDFELVRGGSISGTVTGPGGTPIAEGAVWAIQLDGYHSGYAEFVDGDYVLDGLATGTYEVYAESWDESQNLAVNSVIAEVTAPDLTSGVDIELSVGATISGTVTGHDGEPLYDVEVWLEDEDGEWVAPNAWTDEDGNYTIRAIPTGVYTLFAYDYDNGHARASLTDLEIVAPNEYENVDVSMVLGGSISGDLRTFDDQAVGDAFVWAVGADDETYGHTWTDPDGTFVIEGLPSGVYTVHVEPEDPALQVAVAEDVHVSAGADSSVYLTLLPGGSLSGVVTGPDGEPLEDVIVSVSDGDRWEFDTYTDADGSWLVRQLPSSTYTVSVEDIDGWTTPEARTVVLNFGQSVDDVDFAYAEEVVLPTVGSISGSVAGPDGALGGIEVRVTGEDVNVTVPTNSDGTFEITGLTPGTYTVSVEDQLGLETPAAQSVTVAAGGFVTADFEYEEVIAPVGTGSISGIVSAVGGDALAGVGVIALNETTEDVHYSLDVSSADGSYEVGNLPAGTYTIISAAWASEMNYIDIEVAGVVVTEDADTSGVDLVLAPGGSVTGIVVVGPNGDPVEDAEIVAEDADGNLYFEGGYTDENGEFSLIQLPSGVYTVSVYGPWDTALEDESVVFEGVEVTAGSATALGLIVLGDTPIAPDQGELNDENTGGVLAPTPVEAGSQVTLFVGLEYAGDDVDVWLFSTPAFLGTHTVSGLGTVTVTLPAGVSGSHRIAVYDASGALIGWAPITIVAADSGTGGTGGTGGSGGSAGGTNAGAAGGASLPATGVGASGGLLVIAIAMLAAGLGFITTGRREEYAA